MTNNQTSAPVLRGAAQLLAALPYLIGYRPEHSLVLVLTLLEDARPSGSVGSNSARVAMTVRVDLPLPGGGGELVAALVEPVRRAISGSGSGQGSGAETGCCGPTIALLHAFAHDADDVVAQELLAELDSKLSPYAVMVHDYFVVRGERYLPLVHNGVSDGDRSDDDGSDDDGSDDDGSDDDHRDNPWLPLPAAADVPLVADLVLQGRSPVASRADLVGRIRDRDEHASAATRLAIDLVSLDPTRCDAVDALGKFGRWVAHGGTELSPRARACLCLTLQDRTLRDVVLARWVPDPFAADQSLFDAVGAAVWEVVPPLPAASGSRATPSVHRLLHLAARVPEEFTPPLLTLAAFLAWRSGDGSVANEAVELTLHRDPTYRLALLLNEVLLRGIPPWAMRAADVA